MLLSRPEGVSFEAWDRAFTNASFFYRFDYATGKRVPTPQTLLLFNIKMEQKLMAKRGNSRRNSRSENNMPEFVNYQLNEEEKREFDAWKGGASKQFDDLMESFLADFHKLSVSWDDYNQCFIATATCKDEESDNFNRCLTGRSDTWGEAILVLWFKMTVIFNSGEWKGQETRRNFG